MQESARRVLSGALAGLLSAAAAVGVGEAVAAFVRPAASPVLAVANRVVLATPESTKRSVIETFGTSDKTVLITAVLVLLAIFGVAVGLIALRWLAAGALAVAALGGFGAWCALTDNASRTSDAIPSLVAAAVGAPVLVALIATIPHPRPRAVPSSTESSNSELNPEPAHADRRRFLIGSAAAAGLAALTGFGGRALQRSRFDVGSQRAALALPKPQQAVAGLPRAAGSEPAHIRGADLGRSGVPWATPSDSFYRVDTALEALQIAPSDWSLRVHGLVDRELTLSYDQLLARPLIERWVTLCCVSNEVGGNLIGNARWLGARLPDLLREAGLQKKCDQLLFSSPDGMTIGAPTAVVMDGRDALIAVGMNGAPLPVEHGFPARIVVPGLYGYVSACKWVVDINATTLDAHRAYWIDSGWAQQNAVKLESRIDTPRNGATLTTGRTIPIAGVAWDQHVGVSAVQVQVDGGRWQSARLATVPSTDTWRQWVLPWTPDEPGSHTLRVRAIDSRGQEQTDLRAAPFPSGATGYHTITVTVRSSG